ncbi:MAG: DNA/RNA non-specific endonuclease [Gammaproteobacteria bacterium]|nr:DNA/RNA non-specific endonuclease [Gammaproteobacteria bacterium]
MAIFVSTGAFAGKELDRFPVPTALASAHYQCDQMIHKERYDICYSYKLKAPLWTRFYITKAELEKKPASRDDDKFYEETSIPAKYRAKLADYRSSGYDRGHVTSSRSMAFTNKAQASTYTLANCQPEYPEHNRGIWRYTETLARKLASKAGEAVIYTGGVFDPINPKRIGPGRIAVPAKTYKIVYFPKSRESVGFLVPNIPEDQGKKPSKFRVELKDIEKESGFKFNL